MRALARGALGLLLLGNRHDGDDDGASSFDRYVVSAHPAVVWRVSCPRHVFHIRLPRHVRQQLADRVTHGVVRPVRVDFHRLRDLNAIALRSHDGCPMRDIISVKTRARSVLDIVAKSVGTARATVGVGGVAVAMRCA